MTMRLVVRAAAVVLCCIPLMAFDGLPRSGQVLDEAQLVGRDVASFPAAGEDYFHDMDGGVALSQDEIKGRNMWNVWTGGNDRFWDRMTASTFGALDLLMVVAYDPKQTIDRDRRWNYLGVMNEPCFDPPTGPDRQRFGLLLDGRRADCPADPFANADKYHGVEIGARGKTVPVGSYYGERSGIVGLRLFPNPDFDEAALQRWNSDRYFNDPSYYNDKNLVRPYRVGMSCGFCHVGPSPTNPPSNPARPQWSNLSSTVGAQYLWVDRLFVHDAKPDNYLFQLVHTYRPGAMDTSLVSTDNINNPRTMNAIYRLAPRLDQALRWGRETLSGSQQLNKFNDFIHDGPLTRYFVKPDIVFTPRVLKDGSDSVGVLGALNRVYLNIGLFSEEWLLHFNAVAGGKPITPMPISVAERNSSYWRATEATTPYMASFLVKASSPHRLKDAPGGAKYLTTDQAVLDRGKRVFADTCARCHSSKLPAPVEGLDPAGCNGPGYLSCWNRYWASTKTDVFKQQMRAIVNGADFLDDNYLSSELRVPVTLLQTNACSPLATNALAGNIWDNFSSQSYKDLPSVGQIAVHDPFTGAPRTYTMPAGGRGYSRPASLVSAWSTAPYLLSNSVGPFGQDPSVDARVRVFNASMEQMLWPAKREKDAVLGDKGPGRIDRTTTRSYIRIPLGFQPDILRTLDAPFRSLLPKILDRDGTIVIGPIPAGVPVNLLANLEPLSETSDPVLRAKHFAELVELLVKLNLDLLAMPPSASDQDLFKIFSNLKEPLLKLNKCPDLVVNRGHYFGNPQMADEPPLSDDDKRALIEFVKTF